jgi:excisionase family DNA binding protein
MAGKKAVPEVMTINQARKYAKIRFETMKQLVEDGAIVAQKINTRYRIHKQAVDNWLLGVKVGDPDVSTTS